MKLLVCDVLLLLQLKPIYQVGLACLLYMKICMVFVSFWRWSASADEREREDESREERHSCEDTIIGWSRVEVESSYSEIIVS